MPTADSSPSHERGRPAWVRLATSVVIGIVAGVITGFVAAPVYAPVVGWGIAGAVYLAVTWRSIARMDARQTAEYATREDPTRTATATLVMTAALASLVSIGILLIVSSSSQGAAQDFVAAMTLGVIAVSWLVVHTVFTLRYAMLYYAPAAAGNADGDGSGHRSAGGINFNQDEAPCYTDFAYVAFTIGATFQVSDTDLETHAIRVTALRHALLSYLFGAIILAATVNLVAGLASSSH